jgi:molybdopterin-guanine dinucleotide biosynthesis protein MobB
MKFISVIGYSGAGKTYLIENLIRKIKSELNFEVGVVKYIHEHQIDESGKDSYRFSQSGATFSIIKNKLDESAIFLSRSINLANLVIWLQKSPFKLDVIFFESFRNLPYPTILCVKNPFEIKSQLNLTVKMISGVILKNKPSLKEVLEIPVLDINKDFNTFCEIFQLK